MKLKLTKASLYTHVAGHCAPCPTHAHRGPRLHCARRPADPPPPPAPFVMPVAKTTTPLLNGYRRIVFEVQNAGRPLTARQRRQLRRMGRRVESRRSK